MKNRELRFDRKNHVLYSRPCEKEIKRKIALHYPEDMRDGIWTKVQLKYVEFLSGWRTDLGGRRNFHNGKGGTYDCFAIMAYYAVCKEATSLREVEEIEENLVLPAFRKLKFVDCNKPFWRKLMHMAFRSAKRKCDRWQDYEMHVVPYEEGKPIRYEFVSCPVAEFARRFGCAEMMPALCNVDYASMELMGAKLIRKGICVDGDKCDYAICGDGDAFCPMHP